MDMITMNILESTMVSICREMGITLMKTSYSTIFNEALDFTCGIASPEGDMISVAEFNPAHIGAMNVLMRSCLQEISSDVEPGDVVVHNDPYRGGLHTPEHTFYKPIFVDGELMAFAVAIGHIAEIGGLVPGAFASEATEIFHEGLRIPPVRIRRRGEDVADRGQDLRDLGLLAVRVAQPAPHQRPQRGKLAGLRAELDVEAVGQPRTAEREQPWPDPLQRGPAAAASWPDPNRPRSWPWSCPLQPERRRRGRLRASRPVRARQRSSPEQQRARPPSAWDAENASFGTPS